MIISVAFGDQNPRLRVVGIVVGLGLLVLLAALWRVQVVQAEHFGNRQQTQSIRRIRLPSARGEIVDRHGVVLVNNRPSYDIVLYLEQLGRGPKKQDIVRAATASLNALSQTLGLPVSLTERDVRLHYQKRRPIPLPVWRDVRPELVAAFAERASAVPGADLVVTPVRQYPLGSLAAHALGYVGRAKQTSEDEELEHYYYYQPDSSGRQGVEHACDEYLRGSPGGKTIRVSPGGTMAADLGEKPPERGDRVTLTLDARFQRIVEEALGHTVLPQGKTLRGAAVMIEPNTGEVLALASLPAFDPNQFAPGTPPAAIRALFTDPQSPMINRAIGAKYAPGSTFKTITLLAGLQAGTVHPQDRVVCTGALQIGNHSFGCWNRNGHGSVDAATAIKQSCDVWFYQKGMVMGVDTIDRMAAEFGLGSALGFDVGRDEAGLLPGPAWKKQNRKGEHWWEGDTAQLAIGQSFLLVTPLQMACVAATFANGGTVWRPFLVKRIETPDGQSVAEGTPELRNRLRVAPQNLDVVRRAMAAAVQDPDGTAHRAAVSGLTVAGKTGTAEYDVFIAGTKIRLKRAWFIGFAPVDRPQVALAVLIEDAEGGGHTAAPVAGEILAGVFDRSRGPTADRGNYGD